MTTVRCEESEGNVRILTLEHPPANAINESVLTELAAALDDVERDDAVRALVLTGSGAFFCGGFDFAAPRRDDEVADRLYRLYTDAHRKLLTIPKPTIAMLNGHATAGGLVLVLACDYRLGVDGNYKVGLNEVAVGASFPRAAFEIVRLRLPHARASELILGAALYPASQALRLGIVDELLPADSFRETVLRRAARLGAFPRQAYAHAKANLVAEAVSRIDAEADDEMMRTMSVWITPESRAARARQRAKLGVGKG